MTDQTPMTNRQLVGFMARVQVGGVDGCWQWTGTIARNGYGQFTPTGRRVPRGAHRLSYEAFVEPVPPGLEIDHLCRNKACVNPLHMEAVTRYENLRRAHSKSWAATHCTAGHDYAIHGRVYPSNGYRYCRICATERQRRHVARRAG